MEDNVQVTVVCTAYNHEKYIRKTLDGFVLQKTTFKYKVIVHDDASKDSTPLIIQEYANAYPEIFVAILQKDNKYSKKERILDKYISRMIEGRYIAFCEGDDYWTNPQKLQTQYDILETHPECSICTHLVKCCNENGDHNDETFPHNNLYSTGMIARERYADILWGNRGYEFHTSSYFIRKECNDLYCRLCLVNDVGTLRAAFLCGNMFYINVAMSVRRLFSKDNYNTRKIKGGLIGQMDQKRELIEQDWRIRNYLKGQYVATINQYMLSIILSWAPLAPKLAKEDITRYELDYREIKAGFSRFQRIKYGSVFYALYYFPPLLLIPRVFLAIKQKKFEYELKKIEKENEKNDIQRHNQ